MAGRQWDGANGLVAINYTGTTNRSELSYDGLNRVVKIVEKTGSTINSTNKFVWCGTQRCEIRNTNDGVSLRMYGQGQYDSGMAYFYSRDHLGSVHEMFKSDGTLIARYDYDPSGRSTALLNTIKPDANFTGLYRHAKSNLDFATYRAYDPDLGRWISRDPIGERGGVNLYEYAENNPINATDFLGLKTCWKKVLVTSYWNDSGSFKLHLVENDIAVADTYYTATNPPYNRNHSENEPRILPPGYTPHQNIIVYRPNAVIHSSVEDTGRGHVRHPEVTDPSNWIDLNTRKQIKEWDWISTEVPDCERCPAGWVGDWL